jgi:arylsulfatase A-like enzyme
MSPARNALRAAAAGGGVLLAIHLFSLASMVPAWRELATPARDAVAGIQWHLVFFQLRLAGWTALIGAALGLALLGALTALRLPASAPRVAAGTLLVAVVVFLRTLAHKPALFESMLWRKGGVRAAFQVLFAERIGPRGVDLAVALVLAALLIAAVVRRREIFARRQAWIAVGALAVIAAAAALWPHPRAKAGPRSIVVIAADSLRPDHFSSEGYPRPTTPNLDEFRKRAGWVDDFFVPIASTTPSWASMLTGRYPHAHGIRDLFPRADQTRLRLPTLPRLLAARGYRTAVVSDYAGETFQRVDFGFDEVDAPPATSLEVFAEREIFQRLPLATALFSGGLGQQLFPVAGYLPVNADPALLTSRALAKLSQLERGDKPFLLVVFYSVTHLPFAAPMPDAHAFTDKAYSGPSRYSYEIQQVSDIARAAEPVSEAEAAQVRALYDGALLAFDREAGRILRRVGGDGLRDPVIVVTGDHGESLFEPGATTEHGKWFEGGEAANRTALMISAPGLEAGRLAALASGVDFMPTLLDLAQAPIPPGLDGVSLLHPPAGERTVFAETTLWLGGKPDSPPGTITYPSIVDLLEVEEPSHALVLKDRFQEITVTARLRAARKGQWELVYVPTPRATRWSLFDLAADPHAQKDVLGARPEVAGPMREDLLRFLEADRLRWLDAEDRVIARFEQ